LTILLLPVAAVVVHLKAAVVGRVDLELGQAFPLPVRHH
jgi:hypothetical protein